jgi:dipeptidyl aminopeptidase/acylaminoacyl peptidase
MQGISKNSRLFLPVLVAMWLSGCAETIDYSSASSREEASSRFQKITDDQDNVVGPIPRITYKSGNKFWNYDVRNRLAISADGQRVAFVGEQNGNRNIWVKDVTGGGAKAQRTFCPRVVDPAFSPDGNWISYAEERGSAYNIFMIDSKGGSAVRQVTSDEISNSYPMFSADNHQLFYVQNDSKSGLVKSQAGNSSWNLDSSLQLLFPTGSLWSRHLETGMQTQYGGASTPTFAPDGRVAIVRYNVQTLRSELWLLDLSRSSETNVYSGRGIRDPAVSPDGKQIAFVGFSEEKDKGDNLDIFLIGVDGTNLTRLTFHRGHDVCPRWSPDGKSLYFLSQRGSPTGKWNVWRMELASGDPAPHPEVSLPSRQPAPAIQPTRGPSRSATTDSDTYSQLQKAGATVVVVTQSGTEWTGKVVSVTAESVVVRAGEADLTIRRADIREMRLK